MNGLFLAAAILTGLLGLVDIITILRVALGQARWHSPVLGRLTAYIGAVGYSTSSVLFFGLVRA